MSELEQFALQKVGRTCIVGGADKGIQWGILVTDYILLRALSSKRYSQIICLLSDRQTEDLNKVITGVTSNIQTTSIVCCDVKKLESLDAIYDLCKKTMSSSMPSSSSSSSSSSSDNSKSKALFIYSLTEWILLYGTQRVTSLLDKLATLGFQQIIVCIHQTCHTQAHLSFLSSRFSVTAHTLPNDGTLSGEVLLHIHTTRRSDRSGRVAESSELFGAHPISILSPLKPTTTTQPERRHNIDTPAADTAAEVHNATSVLQRLELSSDSAGGGGAKLPTDDEVAAAAARRLITFESTDPEFDEDSDPDNDLDL